MCKGQRLPGGNAQEGSPRSGRGNWMIRQLKDPCKCSNPGSRPNHQLHDCPVHGESPQVIILLHHLLQTGSEQALAHSSSHTDMYVPQKCKRKRPPWKRNVAAINLYFKMLFSEWAVWDILGDWGFLQWQFILLPKQTSQQSLFGFWEDQRQLCQLATSQTSRHHCCFVPASQLEGKKTPGMGRMTPI